MTDRRTLEDELLAEHGEVDGSVRYRCPNGCGRVCRPFEIVDVRDVAALAVPAACTRCLHDGLRVDRAAAEAAALLQAGPWETPAALEMKAQRDRMLNRWRWTVAADSPLSDACRAAFLTYLGAWHRMTVDAAGPDAFIEPEPPALEYPPADQG